MSVKKSLFNRSKSTIFGVLFAVFGITGLLQTPLLSTPVHAEPAETTPATVETTPTPTQTNPTTETTSTPSETTTESSEADTSENTDSVETCYDQVGALGWFVCPGTGVLSKAIDAIYSQIEKLLIVEPVSTNESSPIFQIWQILRDTTNIIFVIVFLIAIYSQITGLGINNYGLKKVLPKLIIAAILMNLSYIICAIAVDASNIIGANIQGLFENIQLQAINTGGLGDVAGISWTQVAGALIGGGAIAGLAIGVAGGLGALLWPLLGALLIGILSVLIGLLTLGLRHALISILIMIAPLAIICYLLPNTEKWFNKWKELFLSMLIFFPLFSLLYGAAQLAGWALIASSVANGSLFGVVVGLAVQVVPLIMSISLMKMSGTILGKVSGGLDRVLNKPKEGIRAATKQRAEFARNRHVNNSIMPSAHLQRYLDSRRRKQEIDLENAVRIRRGRAEIWAQKAIANIQKFNPADADDYEKGLKKLKTTESTRAAKMAANIELDVKTAQDDAQHIIVNSYDKYHANTRRDTNLANQGARSFKEMNRAAFTLVNDDESDFNYLTEEYLKASAAGPDSYQYKHFVKSAGGNLGSKGSTSVLGQLIAKTAANESRHKHDFKILGEKFNISKRDFRDMVIGYYNDDDGIATFPPDQYGKRKKAFYRDANGNEVNETFPGEFLTYHPEALHPYTNADENGLYYDMYNTVVKEDGTREKQFVTRIYRNDTPVMKEIFQDFDTPIQDPIDGLYGILAGVKKGTYGTYKNGNEVIDLSNVGLYDLRTTIARSLQAAKFKEKAAFAGPMYTAAVSRGNIKNFVDQNIQRLDNIKKTVKSGNFNTQDPFELKLLAKLLDPDILYGDQSKLKYLFPEKELRANLDVNDKLLEGLKFDENGNPIPVSPKDATYEQLLNAVKNKYLYPAAEAIAFMMSRATTPSVNDSLKSGGAEAWTKLANSISKWNSPEARAAHLPNPFEQKGGNINKRAHDIQDKIRKNSTSSAETPHNPNDLASSQNIIQNHIHHDDIKSRALDYISQIESLRYTYIYDSYAFSQATLALIGEDPEFEDIYFNFSNFVDSNPNASSEEMSDYLIDLFRQFDY